MLPITRDTHVSLLDTIGVYEIMLVRIHTITPDARSTVSAVVSAIEKRFNAASAAIDQFLSQNPEEAELLLYLETRKKMFSDSLSAIRHILDSAHTSDPVNALATLLVVAERAEIMCLAYGLSFTLA